MSFVNPYHFVPVAKETKGSVDVTEDQQQFDNNLGRLTFDRYHENALSGRIVCTLETKTPMVIGANQSRGDNPNGYAVISPFEREGRPAIPASTLRGCISSIAEAASNSAMRVLDNDYYSRRTTFNEDIRGRVEDYSAMGMVIKYEGKMCLLPLAMPTLRQNRDGKFVVPPKYRKMFPSLCLKAYCYTRNTLESAPVSYKGNVPQFFYARISGSYSMNSRYEVSGSGGKIKRIGHRGEMLLGLDVEGEPVREPPEEERSQYQRGLLRVLFTENRSEEIPKTKKHEYFLPYPDEIAEDDLYPISDEALNRFHRMASQMVSENERRLNNGVDPLPFPPGKGAAPLQQRIDPYRLQAGDIVFFEPNEAGTEVIKVWISQIWREEIPHRTHDFFKSVNPELLPFHKGRKTITPAEAIFGFVEENEKREKEGGRALASRVRFNEAMVNGENPTGWYEKEIPLRILASPKPPCPAFYFRKKTLPDNIGSAINPTECYIGKRGLNPVDHIPQGRKFYFNHDSSQDILEKAKTNNEQNNVNQKNKARPLKTGSSFVFHIDFENMTRRELGLLLFALKPADSFYHKIGMGKPLGLGSVDIQVAGIFYVDRTKRYLADHFIDDNNEIVSRYHSAWVDKSLAVVMSEILGEHERRAMASDCLTDSDQLAPEALKAEFAGDMDKAIRKALIKIGKPDVQDVGPPLEVGQEDPERETFGWFVNNDSNGYQGGQGLPPLEYGGDDTIMKLAENVEKPRR